jgi:hypothetical protein
MATCDRGHEPITFESPFTSLCPLCVAMEQARNAAWIAHHEAESAIEAAQCEAEDQERRADRAEEALLDYKAKYPGKGE